MPEPEKQPPTVSLPSKAPTGKRCTAGWKQEAALLKVESISLATSRLDRINRERQTRTDFSDLMQTLLGAWLQSPE